MPCAASPTCTSNPMVTEADDTFLLGSPEKREIRIVPSDPRWPERFELHRQHVSAALGDTLLAIHHIGSTSVPGLAVKPIVDILVIVLDSSDESSYVPALEAAGYVLRMREPDWYQHRMLSTPTMDTHVHVFSSNAPEIPRYLLFRDRLRDCIADRDRYEGVKRRLAAPSSSLRTSIVAGLGRAILNVFIDYQLSELGRQPHGRMPGTGRSNRCIMQPSSVECQDSGAQLHGVLLIMTHDDCR